MLTNLITLAQPMNTEPSGALGGLCFLVFLLAIAIVFIAGLWKTFAKAGEPGWAAIIPIVNVYFICKIAGRPGWWLILFLIPVVNIVISVIVSLDVAKRFGKGAGFGIGLWLLPAIFFMILGFGSAQYDAAPESIV